MLKTRSAADLFEDAFADERCYCGGSSHLSKRYRKRYPVFHHAAGLCNPVSVSQCIVGTYSKKPQQSAYGKYAAYADYGHSCRSGHRLNDLFFKQRGFHTGNFTADDTPFPGDELCYFCGDYMDLCTDDERQRDQK